MSERTEPHVIHPDAVYTLGQATATLGLRKSTIAREVREGRLIVSRRAGRYYILGRWLLAWIEAGARGKVERTEPQPRHRAA